MDYISNISVFYSYLERIPKQIHLMNERGTGIFHRTAQNLKNIKILISNYCLIFSALFYHGVMAPLFVSEFRVGHFNDTQRRAGEVLGKIAQSTACTLKGYLHLSNALVPFLFD